MAPKGGCFRCAVRLTSIAWKTRKATAGCCCVEWHSGRSWCARTGSLGRKSLEIRWIPFISIRFWVKRWIKVDRLVLFRAFLSLREEKKPAADILERCANEGFDALIGDRWTAVGTFREFILFDPDQAAS